VDGKLEDFGIELKTLVRKQFRVELKDHFVKVDELFEEFQSYKEKSKTDVRRKADFDLACNTLSMEIQAINNELETIRILLPHDVLTMDEHARRNARTFFRKKTPPKDIVDLKTYSDYNTEDTNSVHLPKAKDAKLKSTILKHMADKRLPVHKV
jgi:hypothetical protein